MKKNELQLVETKPENLMFSTVAKIIEQRKFNIVSTANNQIVLMFWEIGRYINSAILGMERAEYGKRIVNTLSTQLVQKYGKPFDDKNLRRMMQFASQFDDEQIVVTVSRQLSWSHIKYILPLKSIEEKLYFKGILIIIFVMNITSVLNSSRSVIAGLTRNLISSKTFCHSERSEESIFGNIDFSLSLKMTNTFFSLFIVLDCGSSPQ